MTNKNKIINQAQKFIQKGQWDKAIKELQKLVAEDPNDVRTLLKLGDVYSKKGERENATKVYKQVAESYSEQGFFLKAVAVYKQILKHDPKHLDVTLKLAELYEHLGLTSEAMAQYQIASQLHDESGSSREVLDVLRRMVELDADNVASRIKLAESYSRESLLPQAIEEFHRAAEILKRQGRIDDYIKVAERLVYHDPARIDVIKDLAHRYLDKHDTKRALAKLQLCFKAEPRDVETLMLLAGAFRDLGQVQKTIFVYRELARIHQENGQDADARLVLQRILELDPTDAEARAALGIAQDPSRTLGAWAGADGAPMLSASSGIHAAPQYAEAQAFAAARPQGFGAAGSGPRPQPLGAGITPAPHAFGGAGTGPEHQAPYGAPGGGVHAASFGGAGTAPHPQAFGGAGTAPHPQAFGGAGTAPHPQAFGGAGTAPHPQYALGGSAAHAQLGFGAPPLAPDPRPRALATPAGGMPRPIPMIAGQPYSPGPTAGAQAAPYPVAAARAPVVAPRASMSPPPPAAPAPRAAPSSLVPSARDPAIAIGKILTETDVYIKYGLRDKALEHLRRIFEIDPNNVHAYTKMRDIYLATGDTARAAESIANIVHVYAQLGEQDLMMSARAELEQLAPGHPLIAGGGGWTSHPPAEEEDSIDITEDSSVFEVPEELRAGGAGDQLDAWLQDDPAAVAPTETPTPFEEAEAFDTGPFRAAPGPENGYGGDAFAAIDPEAGSGDPFPGGVYGAGGPGADPFAEYPPLDGQPFDESSSVQVGDGDILLSSAVESQEERARAPVERGFDAASFEGEATDAGPVAARARFWQEQVERAAGAAPAPEGTADADAAGETSSPEERGAAPEADETPEADEDLPEVSNSGVVLLPDGTSDRPDVGAAPDLGEGAPPDAGGDDELDEAEFLIRQGLPDEALELVGVVLDRSPDHPRARALEAQLRGQLDATETTGASGSSGAAAHPPEPAANGHHRGATPTLGGEPSDAWETETGAGLAEDAASAEGTEGDEAAAEEAAAQHVPTEHEAEDHYDRGTAYKELNRFDEAIEHFQIASLAPSRELAALEMIGHCLFAKGDFEGAINYFWTALDRGAEPAAATNLDFEIGAAYEAAGDAIQAVEWYRRCFTVSPEHRDVRHRILALGGELEDVAPAGEPAAAEGWDPTPVEPEPPGPKASKKNKISYI